MCLLCVVLCLFGWWGELFTESRADPQSEPLLPGRASVTKSISWTEVGSAEGWIRMTSYPNAGPWTRARWVTSKLSTSFGRCSRTELYFLLASPDHNQFGNCWSGWDWTCLSGSSTFPAPAWSPSKGWKVLLVLALRYD